jgi:hypothetical protein
LDRVRHAARAHKGVGAAHFLVHSTVLLSVFRTFSVVSRHVTAATSASGTGAQKSHTRSHVALHVGSEARLQRPHAPTVEEPLEQAASAPRERVNLLRRTAARVAVSSQVASAKDRPEHLVDGRLDTAWQTQSGDLVGAWIRVRLPKGSHVERLGIVPGFDAVSAKHGDLFTANHRVARILVRQGSILLAEWKLDPNNRHMQFLDVEASDDELTLEIAEVVPGTRKGWSEVCVSELQVLGWADSLEEERTPTVVVGLFEEADVLTDAASGPAAAPCPPKDAWCGDVEPIRELPPEGPYLELARYRKGFTEIGVTLRTPEGYWDLPFSMGKEAQGDSSLAVDAQVVEAKIVAGVLLLRVRYAADVRVSDDINADLEQDHSERVLVCKAAGGAVRCASFITATARRTQLGEDVHWQPRLEVVVDERGRVRTTAAKNL